MYIHPLIFLLISVVVGPVLFVFLVAFITGDIRLTFSELEKPKAKPTDSLDDGS